MHSQKQENPRSVVIYLDPVYESSLKSHHRKLKTRTVYQPAVKSGWKLLEPIELDPEAMVISDDGCSEDLGELAEKLQTGTIYIRRRRTILRKLT